MQGSNPITVKAAWYDRVTGFEGNISNSLMVGAVATGYYTLYTVAAGELLMLNTVAVNMEKFVAGTADGASRGGFSITPSGGSRTHFFECKLYYQGRGSPLFLSSSPEIILKEGDVLEAYFENAANAGTVAVTHSWGGNSFSV